MTKKLAFVFALFCLLVSLCAINEVKAQEETALTINFEPESIKVTESATITVYVEYPIEEGVYGTVGEDSGLTIDFFYLSDAASDQNWVEGPQDVPIGSDGSTIWVFHPEEWGIGEGECVGFYAVFDGDDDYGFSENSTNNLLCIVPTLVVPEYALGGLLAIGVCFGAFALYKKRDSIATSLRMHN